MFSENCLILAKACHFQYDNKNPVNNMVGRFLIAESL
jgi:hypothetical protein